MLLKERENGRRDEVEDVSSYLMTLRKEKGTGIVLSGKVASEEAKDLTVRQNM